MVLPMMQGAFEIKCLCGNKISYKTQLLTAYLLQ